MGYGRFAKMSASDFEKMVEEIRKDIRKKDGCNEMYRDKEIEIVRMIGNKHYVNRYSLYSKPE